MVIRQETVEYQPYKEKRGERARCYCLWRDGGKKDEPLDNIKRKEIYKKYVEKWGSDSKPYFLFCKYARKHGKDVAMNTGKHSHGGNRRSIERKSILSIS